MGLFSRYSFDILYIVNNRIDFLESIIMKKLILVCLALLLNACAVSTPDGYYGAVYPGAYISGYYASPYYQSPYYGRPYYNYYSPLYYNPYPRYGYRGWNNWRGYGGYPHHYHPYYGGGRGRGRWR